MVELVAVPLENGGVIVTEMDHTQAGVVKAERPGQIVGLTLTAEAGAVIAKAASGCHLTATLRWGRDDEPAG